MPDTANNDENILAQYSDQKPSKLEQLKLNADNNPLDLIGKKFQMGSEGVANSRNNAYAMFRTDLSDEEEMSMINQGAAKVGPGFSQSAYEAQPWYLRAVDDAAQTLPGIGDSIVQGGVGGSLAVGANAATLGAVATGIGRINPAAGAAAGGIGTAAVFEGGYTAGSVKSIWEQSAGELYGDLRKSGVKRNTAKTLAFTFGSLNAGLEYIGLHTLQGVAGKFMSAAQKKTIQKSLAHPFVKRIENNMLARLGMKLTEEVATETTTEGAQQTSTELAKVVAGMVQKGKADSFTNWDSAKTNIKDSMLQALGASAILGLGAAGGGHAVGVVTGAVGSKIQKIQADILNQLEGKTPQELLQLMNEGLKQMPNGETTPEQQNASVHYDEQGNPYIKAAVTETGTIPQTTMNEMNRPIGAGKAWTDKIGQTSLADIVNDPQSVIDKGLQAIYPQDEVVQHEPVVEPFSMTDDPNKLNVMQFYHGTGSSGITTSTLDSSITKADSLFGKGVYLTSDPDIAKGYAKARGKKTGTEAIYKASINVTNPLNLEKTAPNEFRNVFRDAAGEWEKDWPFLLDDDGNDTHFGKVLKNPESTGEDIWKAFTTEVEDFSHQEGVSASEFEETFDNIELALSKAGFDALVHTGGKRTGKAAHQVVIILDPSTHRSRISSFIEANPEELKKTAQKTKPVLPSEPTSQLHIPLVEWRNLNPTEVQARQDQIHADIFTLQKEETRLQDQILIAEKSGQSTHKMVSKWRNVTNTIEHLKSESEALDTDFNTQEESPNSPNTARTDIQGPKAGKIRMRKLNLIFDKLAATADKLKHATNKIGAAKDIGYKRGAFETQRAIAKLQADLKNIVNMVTEDPKIRAQVRQYIAGVTTPEQAKQAVENIKKNVMALEKHKFEKQQLQERAKIFDEVKRLISAKITKVSTDKGYPTSQLPQEILEKLNVLRGYLANEKTLKEAEQEFSDTYGDKDINDLPEDAAYDLDLMSKARALYSGDKLTTNIAAAKIAEWVYEGKKIVAERKEALRLQKENDVAEAADSMGIKDTKNKNWVQDAPHRRMAFYNNAQAGRMTWERLLKLISPKDLQHKIWKKLNTSRQHAEYIARTEEKHTVLKQFQADELAKVGSKLSVAQKIANDSKEHLQIRFRNRQGSFTTVTATRAQFRDFVMKFADTSLHPALMDDKKGNGFTMPGEVPDGESAYEVISGIMDEEDRAMNYGTMKFYEWDKENINKAYKEKHGFDLPMRDNYSPVSRSGVEVKSPYGKGGLQMFSLLPGSAKTREESLLAIQPQDPTAAALNHIDQWTYFEVWDPKLTEIANVTTNTTIRDHIRDEYGSGTLDAIDRYVNNFVHNEAIPRKPGGAFWNALSADFSRAVLGGKHITGALTQASSGTALWANYNPVDIMRGAATMVSNPIQTFKAINSSPSLQARGRGNIGHELSSALNQQGLFGSTIAHVLGYKPEVMDVRKHDLINKLMFAGYAAGDAGVAHIFGGVVYNIERSNGSTHEQALHTVEQLMESTQQSTSVQETPAIYDNAFVRTVMVPFSQQPLQILNVMESHVQDFANNINPASLMKLGYQFSMLWLLPGLFTGLIRNQSALLTPPDDDEDRAKAALYNVFGSTVSGPLAGLGMIGDITEMIWFAAAKPLIGVDESKRVDYLGKNPLASFILNDVWGSVKAWEKLTKEDSLMDTLNSIDLDGNKEQLSNLKTNLTFAKAGTKALGVPTHLVAGPLAAIERLENNDSKGAVDALLGWSPSAVAERQSKNSDLFGSKGLDLKENSNAYDTMKTYLDTYLAKQKPTKPDSTNKEFIDTLVKESQKP